MAISDFVLLHNKAAEGLVKTNRVGYDIYSDIADIKGLFSKYCKHYEKRLAIDSSESEGKQPGFGCDAVSQKLRRKNLYIVVAGFKRNGSQNSLQSQ
jgi:hypothetical protein